MQNVQDIIKHTASLKLLYVEDDQFTRESALPILEDFFDEITVATNGLDGFEKFKNSHIDLIITDINIPQLSGLEMIKKIRKIDESIPVIIISAYMEPKYFIKSIQLNVKGYLLKPIEMDRLLDIFRDIITASLLKIEIAKNQKIKEQDHKYLQSIIDSVQDPIMAIKKDYTIDLMNSKLRSKLKDVPMADRDHPKCYEVSHHRSTPCDGEDHICPLNAVLESQERCTVIHKHFDQNQKQIYIELAATPLFDEAGACIGIVESARDITTHIKTQQKLQEQKDQLHYLAYHDALTHLPNRVLFDERLDQAILNAEKNSTKMALFFIDLNKFKYINDTLGHKAGDEILKVVAEQILAEIKPSDTIARIGGDEFTVILNDIQEKKDTKPLAKKILAAIEQPIDYQGHKLQVSASIGIAIYSDDATDPKELLKYADIAMYRAKGSIEKIVYYTK